MQAFINLRCCATTAFHQHRRGWSGTGGSLPRHGSFKLNHSPAPSKPAHHQLITTKIAGKDSDVPYERNRPNTNERRFQYVTWLVNLGQYSHLHVYATSSIPSFTGVHQRQVYILLYLPTWVLFTTLSNKERSRAPPSKLSSMSWWSSWFHVHLIMKKSSSSTARGHISTSLFHRVRR